MSDDETGGRQQSLEIGSRSWYRHKKAATPPRKVVDDSDHAVTEAQNEAFRLRMAQADVERKRHLMSADQKIARNNVLRDAELAEFEESLDDQGIDVLDGIDSDDEGVSDLNRDLGVTEGEYLPKILRKYTE